MKRVYYLLMISLLILALTACSANAEVVSASGLTAQESSAALSDNSKTAAGADSADPVLTPSLDLDSDDLNDQTSGEEITYILLEGNKVSVQGSGAEVNGSQVTINGGGSYQISGSLDNGQVIVDSLDDEIVHLFLSGVEITSLTSAPFYIRNAEKTVITLAENSVNILSDGESTLQDEEGEPNAALFSKDDLTINGTGFLFVNGSYDHGIVSKDDLKIVSGSITVEAVNDGIKGRDSITVVDGVIEITAGGDGMQSTNQEDPEKGSILIEGGTFQISAGQDGIQAETSLVITGGEFNISAGGGSANGLAHTQGWGQNGDFNDTINNDSGSAKGLKAGGLLSVADGVFRIDTADDALHSNGSVNIQGGVFQIASGDDGVHADSLLEISGGSLDITESYEGIESAEIHISGGEIHLVASDDGINGSTGSGQGGMPGMDGFGSGDSSLVISGGYVYVDAGGDGIDINGPVAMSGGTVLVNGPTNSGNGALDYTGEFNITGGILVAVGSAGMAEAPSQSSGQLSVQYIFENMLSAGTAFHLESQTGEEILTFVPAKQYQAVVVSSPDLVSGETYQIYSGGSSTGSLLDGLASGGAYSGGTMVDSLTLTGVVTSGGIQGGGMMGGPGDGSRPPHSRGN